ncbi:aconitase X [Thalassorhabdomicrobium marinisediminis]|uniref:cis-3-hydroxy-L-proline dehydratase n=1 Tax=Thalassorhabdomicrobium marinisediminis TaxID=2170577 RepID=UPI002492799A|nr:aconitase X [Thalassorhabdomicrobium marinisediminis]
MSGLCILPGHAEAPVLASEEGLSFWGGIDPATGVVIDAHHPLHGTSFAGRIVMMPTTRGSCTGSGVLLELIQNAHAPAALIFREDENVLTLGALVAKALFGLTLPVIRLPAADFAALAAAPTAKITPEAITAPDLTIPLAPLSGDLELSDADLAMRDGDDPALRMAMQIIETMAHLQGAPRLIDVSQVHIDGCIYASPANLRFAQKVADMGAQVRVPTTMNAISVDHGNWREQGVPPDFGRPAQALADAYVTMGARPSFTCAPYLLDTTPKTGEVIAWSESNAVIYANSVLSARTEKHPDFFDLCIALTGRAPLAGPYLDENRAATLVIDVTPSEGADDALWPMLGYLAGLHAPDRIPLLTGLEHLSATDDDLKALCAAFGTTSAAPMLHVAGHTPEAHQIAANATRTSVTADDLARVWAQFNAGPAQVDLVAFGSPHFSLSETRRLAELLDGHRCHPDTATIVTLGRDTLAAVEADGTLAKLHTAGVQVVPDICWCSISEPVFPPSARTLMTNSGKYAHYAPGLSDRAVRFGSLADCAHTARTGTAPEALPSWLAD